MIKEQPKQSANKPQIDFSKTKAYTCDAEGCDNEIFMPAMKFRMVSKLVAGTTEDQLIPVQVFMCTRCGNINADFDVQD